MNPNCGQTRAQISNTLTHKRTNITLKCQTCDKEYSVLISKNQFIAGKFRKHCSRSCANKRDVSKETAQKIRDSLKGRTRASAFKIACCSICLKPFQRKRTSYRKTCSTNCLRKACGKAPGGYRPRKTKTYRGHGFDSTWEVKLAERLDALNIRWERNERGFRYLDFQGRSRRYHPDFYLPDYQLFVEVKGYASDATLHKMNDAQSRNNLKLCILRSLEQISNFDPYHVVKEEKDS